MPGEIKSARNMSTPTGMVNYDRMCAAIAECHRVDEVKDIRDRAEALRVYHRQAGNFEAERQAAWVRLRAERRIGQMLIEMRERGEREGRGGDRKSKFVPQTLISTLKDLGISKTASHLWQRLAREIPEKEFESSRTSGKAVSAYELLREREIMEVGRPKRLEYVQKDKTAFRSIRINFANEEDVAEFADLLGVNITPRTRSLWFPAAEIGRVADKRYVDAGAGSLELLGGI